MRLRTQADFTAVYREQYDDLLRFVRRRAHPPAVDDIVGETFLAAWRRRAELPAEVRPWLFRTARNLMLNSARGMNRQDALAVRIGTLGVTPTGADLDERLDLRAAWQCLPSAEQEILALSVWEELTTAEGAAVLGCTRGAYSMRLSRAKAHLAALLRPAATLATSNSH